MRMRQECENNILEVKDRGRRVMVMRTHEQVDRRSLRLASEVASRIDADPSRAGLIRARETCRRWHNREPLVVYREWFAILKRPWSEVRQALLDPSEDGRRLRQTDPFCGVLSPRERWKVYKEFAENEARGS